MLFALNMIQPDSGHWAAGDGGGDTGDRERAIPACLLFLFWFLGFGFWLFFFFLQKEMCVGRAFSNKTQTYAPSGNWVTVRQPGLQLDRDKRSR